MNVSMNVYDEMKNSKDFVYKIKNKYYVIGWGVFLNCTSDIKYLYNNFLENVEKVKFEIETKNPRSQIFDKCLESFKILIDSILKKEYGFSNEYKKDLLLLNERLNEKEKIAITNQRNLFIFFLSLVDYEKIGVLSFDDWYKIKNLK